MIKENQRLVHVRTDSNHLTCIVCPIGCELQIDRSVDGIEVAGHQCKRGVAYANAEYEDPRRIVTGTCAISDAPISRVPVRSTTGVPVESISNFLIEMYAHKIEAPVDAGTLLIRNVAGTGVDLIATMSIQAVS